MKGKLLERRKFLTLVAQGSVAAAAIAATGQMIRFLSYRPATAGSNIIPVGQPNSFTANSLTYVAEARAYIRREANGWYAIDAVCTHLGCLVEPAEEEGFVCPCHDSRFDAQGRPTAGPATKPLRYLQMWLDAEQGLLMVDRDQAVEASVRFTL